MNILLIIVVVILAIIAIPLILALFTKKSYIVKEEVLINKSSQEVFDFIKILKNQSQFSKWVMADPNSKMTLSGTDGTVGFKSAWDSANKQVGKGEQEIKGINDGVRMDVEVRFEKPFKGTSDVYYTTDALPEGGTKLVWAMTGHMNYPMNALLLFMDLPGMLRKDMKESLGNLKVIMEK